VLAEDLRHALGHVVQLGPLVGDEAECLRDHAERLETLAGLGRRGRVHGLHRVGLTPRRSGAAGRGAGAAAGGGARRPAPGGLTGSGRRAAPGRSQWWCPPPLGAPSAWNEWPQPQVDVALGFLMAKPPPMRSSL